MSQLREAVEEWIRADFQFRLSANPFTHEAQERLIRAEENLRRALTGKKYLHNAAKALGVRVDTAPFKPLSASPSASKPSERVRVRPKGEKQSKGLFD